ncbi:MAG: hybrid sensor histidine kinase/response regulator [Aquabacterium sp.]
MSEMSSSQPLSSSSIHVLVVDDVAQNLVAMEALLRSDTVKVLTARSGNEALELLLDHDVALALLDVQMPEMDGFTLAELMRGAQRTRHVPIIFLTASPSDPVRSFQGYESGAVDFLNKPVDPLVIRSKVQVFVELYRQRQLLHARNAELERVLKLNETMIAVLSHDLRTPLAAIMMYAEALRMTPDSQVAKTGDRVRHSARRMAHMIDQLLDFSRIRSDVIRPERQQIDLGVIASRVVEELRQAHPEARLDLELQGDLKAVLDGGRMAQVLANLAGNAIVHGEAGQPVQVVIDGRAPPSLHLCVRNAGRIPDDLLPRIFEPFKREAGQLSQGLGLGLYIVDQFVRAQGGQVQAINTEAGAMFDIVIPRHAALDGAPAPLAHNVAESFCPARSETPR